eukprot:scaffold5681_cov196-Alexandrium_tamarense.AAC.24
MARHHSKQTKEPRLIDGDSNDNIDESDDEEIDEDEAFNSEDEMKYGSFFVGHGSKKSKKKSAEKMNGEDNDEDDGNSSDEGSYSEEDDGSNDWAGESDSDEEDDGGQYMLDLLNNLDKQVPGKGNADKKESFNGKIQLDNVPAAAVQLEESEFGASTISTPSAAGTPGSNKLTLDSLMGGISDTQGFTDVQRSMRVLSNGKSDYSTKKMETTAVPLPRVVTERASRKVHYQSTKEDVTQWKDVIHTHRDAETLDFRVNKGGSKASAVTKDRLVEKFEARTEFEEELARALEVAGMEDEKAMRKREKKRLLDSGGNGGELSGDDDEGDDEMEDDLGSNRISIEGEQVHCAIDMMQSSVCELANNTSHVSNDNFNNQEYKKRHGELAKMRALLFYEEQKRHRINKIKSKKYRKIRKRQREREKDAEDEAARLDGEISLCCIVYDE